MTQPKNGPNTGETRPLGPDEIDVWNGQEWVGPFDRKAYPGPQVLHTPWHEQPTVDNTEGFEIELSHLINTHSMDNYVNVADDILAGMIVQIIQALRIANLEQERRRA